MKIIELTESNNLKWNDHTKEQKKEFETKRIKAKQEIEFTKLKLKIDSTLNEFTKKRKVEFEK
jgi:hypothetical protein